MKLISIDFKGEDKSVYVFGFDNGDRISATADELHSALSLRGRILEDLDMMLQAVKSTALGAKIAQKAMEKPKKDAKKEKPNITPTMKKAITYVKGCLKEPGDEVILSSMPFTDTIKTRVVKIFDEDPEYEVFLKKSSRGSGRGPKAIRLADNIQKSADEKKEDIQEEFEEALEDTVCKDELCSFPEGHEGPRSLEEKSIINENDHGIGEEKPYIDPSDWVAAKDVMQKNPGHIWDPSSLGNRIGVDRDSALEIMKDLEKTHQQIKPCGSSKWMWQD